MKIRSFEVNEAALALIEGYRIAGHSINTATNFVVRLESDNGIAGYGCAAPAEEVTGETDALCREALDGVLRAHVENALHSPDPSDLCLKLLALAPGAPAACAAIDIALWDIAAQAAGQPLVERLGDRRTPMPTSVTIGICETAQALDEAAGWVAKGFNVLKVKTGEDTDADIDRLQQLRAHFGNKIVIRVDANQGYSLAEARRFLAQTKALNLEMLEQPLPAEDLDGAASLCAESAIPILADESVVSIADAERVIRHSAASGINIKLMKCGGLTAAKLIHDSAHKAGLSVMLGCNDETRISIAAALHFSLAMPGVRYIDLDGHMDLADDPVAGGFTVVDGEMRLGNKNGLGVQVNM